MADKFTPNQYEIQVLRMFNNEIPWERGAWVNACAEFLSEAGFVTSMPYEITLKGKEFLLSIQ